MFTKLGHHVHTQMPSVKLMFTKPWPCDHKGMGSMFTQRCPLFSDVHKIMTVIKMLWHHVHTGMPSVHTDVYKVMTLHSQSDDPAFTKWWPCVHKVMTLRSQSDDPAFTKWWPCVHKARRSTIGQWSLPMTCERTRLSHRSFLSRCDMTK